MRMQRFRRAVVAAALVAGVVVMTGFMGASARMGLDTVATRTDPSARTVVLRSAAARTIVINSVLLPSGPAQTVVINCTGHGQIKPKGFALACAGGNKAPGNYLTGLHWRRWGRGRDSAYGVAVEHSATCVGSTRVAVTLWRPRPLHGHKNWLYFTRITVINKGAPTPWAARTSTIQLWS
jgi:hypothetical protein